MDTATDLPTASTKGSMLVPALADALATLDAPAISPYELGRLVFAAATALPESEPQPYLRRVYREAVTALMQVRLLSPINSMAPSAVGFRLFGRKKASPAEVACSLDPFAYLSHLSAMEYHGLTDRFPKTLFMSAPARADWRSQAQQRMLKDLGPAFEQYKGAGLPLLSKPNIATIDKTVVQLHERSQMGAFRRVAGSPLCVATIGRTFLDMLREPQLCGGIEHVLDVYAREAKRYATLVVDEVERHGTPVDKVRIGYVLSVLCGVQMPAVEGWKSFAQRGGSRKLDPGAEYSPAYSAEWKLSLNVPLLQFREDDLNDT